MMNLLYSRGCGASVSSLAVPSVAEPPLKPELLRPPLEVFGIGSVFVVFAPLLSKEDEIPCPGNPMIQISTSLGT